MDKQTDSLVDLTMDVAADTFRTWRDLIDEAEDLRHRLPDSLRVRAEQQGASWDSLVPTLAMLDPATLTAGRVLLDQAVNALEGCGPLSHPLGSVGAKTETQIGAGMDWQARVDELEARVVDLEAVADQLAELNENVAQLRMTLQAAATLISSPMTGTSR